MNEQLKSTLVKITRRLNETDIMWALGASGVLNYHGLLDEMNDIDILVAKKDCQALEDVLKSMGYMKDFEPSDVYGTEYFREFVINEVDVDVMSNMKIFNHQVTYDYIFDHVSVVGTWALEDVKVPLTSLEEWYILYQMIPNREKKVQMIEGYLQENGANIKLLEKLDNLPDFILKRINHLKEQAC